MKPNANGYMACLLRNVVDSDHSSLETDRNEVDACTLQGADTSTRFPDTTYSILRCTSTCSARNVSMCMWCNSRYRRGRFGNSNEKKRPRCTKTLTFILEPGTCTSVNTTVAT